jgi:lactate permease
MIIPLILSLLPIVLVLVLLLVFNKSGHFSGFLAWVVTALVVVFFFQTKLEVVLRSTLAGCIRSFPNTLMIMFSILQVTVMEKHGAIRRITVLFKTLAPGDKASQVMMLNIGFGTLMVAVGATPVSALPALLLGMGYTSFQAIALPAIGYDSLCTYALLGAPIVVFYDIANGYLGKGHEVTLVQCGSIFYYFLPLVSTSIGLAMLYIVDRWKGIRKGWFPCLLVGATVAIVAKWTNSVENLVCLTGLITSVGVILVQMAYLKLKGGRIYDPSVLTEEDRAIARSYPLWRAFLPWVFLIAAVLSLNLPKASFNWLFNTMRMRLSGITANGGPLDLRLLWQAYTWCLISIVVTLPFLMTSRQKVKDSWASFLKRAPKPVLSSLAYFAIGEIMNMSGYNMAENRFVGPNMVRIMADFSAHAFGRAYGAFVSYIGLVGGFITGSEASAVAMLGRYSMLTAANRHYGLRGLLVIAAGVAFGGGLASVITPVKLQNAAAVIDRLGEENAVLRVTMVFSLIFCAVTAVLVLVLTGVFAGS